MPPVQPSLPMIIAVKGHSSSRNDKSKSVANQLANYLKYLLIDQDDFVPAPDSVPSSSTQSAPSDLNDSSFKTAHQIASEKLRSKLRVVIHSPLSDNTHLDQLKQLASSQGAELILIQCQPSDPIDGFGDRTLTVDSDAFDVEKCVSEILQLALPQAADSQPKNEKLAKVIPQVNLGKSSSLRPSRKKVPEKTYRHLHELTFYAKPKNNKAGLHCKSCGKEFSSGPSYQCLECDEYVFHKSCAESPGNLELVRKDCPHYLRAREPEYRFQKEMYKCKICEDNNREFSNDCYDCLFQTNIKGKFLPIVVNHESHAHPLNLIIAPLSLNYEYGCCGCGELGKSISYRCYDCNFNLHVSCVLLQPTLKYDKHTLKLTYGSLEENCWDKSNCKVCNKETHPEKWFYYSPATESVTHIGCV